MNDLTYRADLANDPHTITVETITPELCRDSDLPAAATLVVIERHHGRLAKVCNATDVHVADLLSLGHSTTIEDLALGITETYGAVYVPSTVIRTVPARDGMLGYQVHALRSGAPLPGGTADHRRGQLRLRHVRGHRRQRRTHPPHAPPHRDPRVGDRRGPDHHPRARRMGVRLI